MKEQENPKTLSKKDSEDVATKCSSLSLSSAEDENFNTDRETHVKTAVYLYALIAALNSCNLGYDLGVSTNAGPLLKDDIGLSDFQLELFLGSLNFWSIFGACLSPVVSDKYGRRMTLGVAAIGFIIGLALQVTSYSYISLMCGRMVVGLAVGLGEAIDPMYIAEISPKHIRGRLVSLAEAGVALGVVLGFSSSFFSEDWRKMIGAGAIMPAIMLFLVKMILPESPRWLVQQGQEAAARVLLQRLYGEGEVEESLQEMQDDLAIQQQAHELVGWSAIYSPSPAVRRMLIVGIGMATIQQAVGIDAIMFYLLFVIEGSGIRSEKGQTIALVTLGIIKLAFVFVGAHLLDTKGRRPLLLFSLIGCAFSLLCVSFTFLYESAVSNVLTVVFLGTYLAFFSAGLGPGNWVVVSEIFATSIRAKAMCVAIIPNRITATFMASSFLTLSKLFTWPGFFLILTFICLISALFIYIYLPETKNKSLEEMAGYFAEITGDQSLCEIEAKLRHRAHHEDNNGNQRIEVGNCEELAVPAESGTMT